MLQLLNGLFLLYVSSLASNQCRWKIRRKLEQADLFEESRLLKKSRGKKISHTLGQK